MAGIAGFCQGVGCGVTGILAESDESSWNIPRNMRKVMRVEAAVAQFASGTSD